MDKSVSAYRVGQKQKGCNIKMRKFVDFNIEDVVSRRFGPLSTKSLIICNPMDTQC